MSVLLAFLQGEDADRFVLQLRGYVAGGGLHGTTAGLVSPAFSTTAFPGGIYATDSGLITYANTSTTHVIMSPDTTGNLGGYTRVAGTHYLTSVAGSAPALPTDCIRLMRVTTAGGAITAVVDQRQLSPLVNRTDNPYVRLIGTESTGSDLYLRETVGLFQIAKNTGSEDNPTLAARLNFAFGAALLGLNAGAISVARTQSFPDKDGTFAMLSDLSGSVFAAGTRMLFDNDSAPTGWTRDAVINDAVPRIVTGTRDPDGGSWTVAGLTVASHTHTLSAHQHDSPTSGSDGVTQGYVAKTSSWGPGSSANTYTMDRGGAISAEATRNAFLTGTPDPDVTGSTSASLSSDGTWRPLYRDHLLAEKN